MDTIGPSAMPILLDRQIEGGVERTARAEIILEGTGKTRLWERVSRQCGHARIGTWSGEKGLLQVNAYPNDEVFVVTRGRIRLHGETEDLTVRPGQGAFVPRGWKGKWENVEESEKVFVILTSEAPS